MEKRSQGIMKLLVEMKNEFYPQTRRNDPGFQLVQRPDADFQKLCHPPFGDAVIPSEPGNIIKQVGQLLSVYFCDHGMHPFFFAHIIAQRSGEGEDLRLTGVNEDYSSIT